MNSCVMDKKIYKKINYNLKNNQGIRALDIYDYGKKKNLDFLTVKKAINQSLPYLYNKSYTKSNKRDYQSIRIYSLGFLHADIAFFPKSAGRTPKNIVGFVVMVDILSHRCFTELIYNNKSSDSLIKTFKKLINQYEKVIKRPINAISFDRDLSFTSIKFKTFITKKKGIELILFENSRNKSFMSELYIGQLKRLYTQNKIAAEIGGKKYPPMYKVLRVLEVSLNNRYLYINGKKTNYKPSTVTYKNLNEYLEVLKKLYPKRNISNFVYRSDFYKFKFNVGDLVYSKLNSITPLNTLKNRGTSRSISKKIFIIKKLFLYVSKNHYLTPAALCAQMYPVRKGNSINKNPNLFFFKTYDLIKVPDKIADKKNFKI